ncbi:MAG: SIR2 family protein [Dehalococcoidia bacterium]|nr:SIR2 family protein [Dehalococcoidia bacterium]
MDVSKLEDVVEFINSGECLAFVGSGPSCELGLPDWTKLAHNIFAKAKARGPGNLPRIKDALDKGDYPTMFELIENSCNPAFLIAECKKEIADPGGLGRLYGFLARFPFKGYLTTNYDDLLARHLRETQHPPITLCNSEEDLGAVDFDQSLTVVKVHGDFSAWGNIILTRSQFHAAQLLPRWSYYRTFLDRYLGSRRVVLFGYSLKDPDIEWILKNASALLRRKLPIYAFFADATLADIERFSKECNVEVISYENKDGRHFELLHALETMSTYVACRGERARQRVPVDDLKRAQALFMWHRISRSEDDTHRVSALKSVILNHTVSLASAGKWLSAASLEQNVQRMVGISQPYSQVVFKDAIEELQRSGYVDIRGAELRLTALGTRLLQTSSRQFSLIQSQFLETLHLRISSVTPGVSRNDVAELEQAALNCLLDIFSQRGVELANAVLGVAQVRRSAHLLKLIALRANDLTNQSLRLPFIEHMTRMLTQPSDTEEAFLSYLSRAFFCLNALQMDPDGSRFQREFLSGRALLLDSNILIPFLAKNESRHAFTRATIEAARLNGIRLFAVHPFVKEAVEHASWAKREIVDKFGAQSPEVLDAAQGRGVYRRNAFLEGFIETGATGGTTSFAEYLKQCFGGGFTEPDATRHLSSTYGVTIITSAEALPKLDGTQLLIRENEFEETIRQLDTELTWTDRDKDPVRVGGEAEVFAIIWQSRQDANYKFQDVSTNWAFLSSGGFLNRLNRAMAQPIPGNIVW